MEAINIKEINYFDYFNISNEILTHIFRKLPIEDLVAAMRSCKRFYVVGKDARIWKIFYTQECNPNCRFVLESGKKLDFYKIISDFHNFEINGTEKKYSRHLYPLTQDISTEKNIYENVLWRIPGTLPRHLIVTNVSSDNITYFDLHEKKEFTLNAKGEFRCQNYDRLLFIENHNNFKICDLDRQTQYDDVAELNFNVENLDEFKKVNEKFSKIQIKKTDHFLCRGIDLTHSQKNRNSITLNIKYKNEEKFKVLKEIEIDFMCDYAINIDFRCNFISCFVTKKNRETNAKEDICIIYDMETGGILPERARNVWALLDNNEVTATHVQRLVTILEKEQINLLDFPGACIKRNFFILPVLHTGVVDVYNLEHEDGVPLCYLLESDSTGSRIALKITKSNLLVTLGKGAVNVWDMNTGKKLHETVTKALGQTFTEVHGDYVFRAGKSMYLNLRTGKITNFDFGKYYLDVRVRKDIYIGCRPGNMPFLGGFKMVDLKNGKSICEVPFTFHSFIRVQHNCVLAFSSKAVEIFSFPSSNLPNKGEDQEKK